MTWLHLCQLRMQLISFDTATLAQDRLALAAGILDTYLDPSSTDAVEELFSFHDELDSMVTHGDAISTSILGAILQAIDAILGEEPFRVFKSGPYFSRYLQWKVSVVFDFMILRFLCLLVAFSVCAFV